MGGGAGFMSSRGTANLLTRTTAILAVGFFLTSLALAWIAGVDRKPSFDLSAAPATQSQPGRRDADRAADLAAAFWIRSRRSTNSRRTIRPAAAAFAIKQGGYAGRRLPSCIRTSHQCSEIALNFNVTHSPAECSLVACDSFWRIGPVALKVESHGAVHIHHRRRGFFARKRSGFSGTRCPAAGARVQGPSPQARSLSQPRSRNDVAVSARRSVRDRRRRRDRSRSRPLRALHRASGHQGRQHHHRAHLSGHHHQGTPRRLSRRDHPGGPARHQRDQGIRALGQRRL